MPKSKKKWMGKIGVRDLFSKDLWQNLLKSKLKESKELIKELFEQFTWFFRWVFVHESDGHDEGHPNQGKEKSRKEMARGGFFLG